MKIRIDGTNIGLFLDLAQFIMFQEIIHPFVKITEINEPNDEDTSGWD
jgi:hypothetical protein